MRTEAVRTHRVPRGLNALLAAAAVALALWSLATPAHAAGETRYVSPTGTDAGDCTDVATPCATIDYAAGVAEEGDEVLIAEGTYAEVANFQVHDVTFTGMGNVMLEGGLAIQNSGNVTVRGIEIQTTGVAIELTYSTGILIENVALVAQSTGGIALWSIGSVVEIRDSEVLGDFDEGLRFQRDVGGELDYTGSGFPIGISNVNISDAQIGVELGAMSGAEMHGVSVVGAEVALRVGEMFLGEVATTPVPAAPTSASVVGNYLGGAVEIYGKAPGGLEMHSNQVIGGVVLTSDEAIDVGVERNWWGSSAGPPAGAFTYDGSAAGAITVDFDPWCLDEDCTTFSSEGGNGGGDGEGGLPPLPPYYSVPPVVSVTLDLGDDGVVDLPARPKDEWIDEARELLPDLRRETWFPDVIVEVDEAGGRVHITVSDEADLSEYMHLLP